MDRPEHLPICLDKETLSWLRVFGYCLNDYNEPKYKKLLKVLKQWYTFEYYLYIDYGIRSEAEKIFDNEDKTTREYYRSYNKRLLAEKKRLIKKLYGLEKKGIR